MLSRNLLNINDHYDDKTTVIIPIYGEPHDIALPFRPQNPCFGFCPGVVSVPETAVAHSDLV